MSINHLLADLPDHTRIWLYLAEQPFNKTQESFVEEQLAQFTHAWQAHGSALSAGFAIWQQQLLILGVDETQQAATGCSIDASYRIIKHIEQHLGVSLSNRLLIPIWEKEKLKVYSPHEAAGLISAETQVLDLTLTTLGSFRQKGISPIADTWMKRYLTQAHVSS